MPLAVNEKKDHLTVRHFLAIFLNGEMSGGLLIAFEKFEEKVGL